MFRVGLYFVGICCLMGGSAWAEAVPYLGTAEQIVTYNLATNTGTYRRAESGSTNAYGAYTCTSDGSIRGGTPESCGSDAAGFFISNVSSECNAEGVDYHYTAQVNDFEICIPRTCFSPDPPNPLRAGCSYSASWTGTLMGGDGVTTGFTGSFTVTDTLTVRGEENDGETSVARTKVTTQGTADIEFIEEPPVNDAVLGIPAPGSTVNGVGLISGWSCLGGELKAEIIDAGEVIDTVTLNHGSARPDTVGICGDIDNGFSATGNWSNYPEGEKTIRFFHNGELITSRDFSILKLSDTAFLTGSSGMCVVNNFPTTGREVTIEWDESRQGFFPTGIRASQ